MSAKRKIQASFAVIGDGPTETIYVDSIKRSFADKMTQYKLKPDVPKHSTVKDLEVLISNCLTQGYDKVLCLVDMDTKVKNNGEMLAYNKLKKKFTKKPVYFYKTHPCTELWFYYHFDYTTAQMSCYDGYLKKMVCGKIKNYEKKEPFCTHQHICIKSKGDFEKAISNARRSIESRCKDGRSHTYSEMATFFEDISIVDTL